MQPYPNPNYFTQYQQQFNPYMQRMENLQQFQQSLNPAPQAQPFTPLGKMVESVDIVKVTDIPMDGNMYYFPKADGTEVYSKQFMPNGQTRILTFKPVLDADTNNVSNAEEKLKIGLSDEATEVFMKRFDDIEKRLDEFIGKKTTNRVKKEAETE